MYFVVLEKSFIASARKLENSIKNELNRNLELLSQNPFHLYLHLKPLHGPLKGFHSFRVVKYRVIIEFLKENKIRVLDIEKRDKVYKN